MNPLARSRFALSSLLPLLILLLAPLAHAEGESAGGDVWLVSAGSTFGLNYQTGTTSTTSYQLTTGLGHSWDGWEPMVLATYLRTSVSGAYPISQSEIDVQAGYVLWGSHLDAFYIGPRVGFLNTDTGVSSYSSTVFGGVLGKRFNLTGAVCYEPNVSATWAHDQCAQAGPVGAVIDVCFMI